MNNEISDDDLNLRASRDDRMQAADDEAITVQSPNGGAALKSIFAPANRKRLIMYIGAGVLLTGAIFYTFFSVSEEDAAQQQVGAGSSNRASVKTSAVGGDETWMAQEARETYNQEVLPEIQKENPFAHPLLDVTDTGRLPPSEPLPNPFAEEAQQGSPRRLSDAVTVDQDYEAEDYDQPSRGRRQTGPGGVEPQAVDSLIEALIAAEGERQPVMQRVSWSYAPPAEQQPQMNPALANSDSATSEDIATADPATSLCSMPLARAGQQYMATADIGLNSDVGGPVSFTVRNGPLRNGQMMGSFERLDKWVRINLNRIVLANETLPITAIALDMDTTLNAVEGHLDRHIMYRYGWWGVGTTLRAIGRAAEINADNEIYVSDGVAIQSSTKDSEREVKIAMGELGQELGDVMRDRINRPITVSLNVGDEVGIFVLEDICSSAGSRRG